jgi:DNA-binding transcriptional regulator YiaG
VGNLRYTGTGRSLTFSLPDRLPASCTIVAIGAGALLVGSTGSHATGNRMVSALSVQPLVQDHAIDRRRRLAISASQALSEIRLWTGLAWGTIAEILSVSRKAVHNWSSGEEPTGMNADRLLRLHERAGTLFKGLGPTSAGLALSLEYKVEPRGGRASPRRGPSLAGPILENDHSLVAAPLQMVGTRSRRPIGEA